MSADYRILMKHTEWLVYIRRNYFLVHACINWCSQMFIRLKHLNGGRYLTKKTTQGSSDCRIQTHVF